MDSVFKLAETGMTIAFWVFVLFIVLNAIVKLFTIWELNVERRAYIKVEEEAEFELTKLKEEEYRNKIEHEAKLKLIEAQRRTEELKQAEIERQRRVSETPMVRRNLSGKQNEYVLSGERNSGITQRQK